MKARICTALLALSLVVPVASMAQEDGPLDPFGGISVGIAQGMFVGDDFDAESEDDNRGAQGGNVIVGNTSVATLQVAGVGNDLDLEMEDGNHMTQGLNVIKGEVAVLALQGALIGDDVDLESENNNRSAQGVNVVNACEGCN